jgi:hypothetical protein
MERVNRPKTLEGHQRGNEARAHQMVIGGDQDAEHVCPVQCKECSTNFSSAHRSQQENIRSMYGPESKSMDSPVLHIVHTHHNASF